ncbi:winged helix DNA-binding domain-containing protein [Streptomyces sp.]|uniref:winged helix DNA-binding domain-containing protein n=1 Tax=Streptomyces sp. TaxID=1931 RepID=UPI0028113D3F|nr:winged helix DNA-binding domain-containing protein [Streptomyces sp.]
MVISERALNRATLARQLLLARAPVGTTEAVRRVVALQAQHPGSPYLALWNRVAGFDPAGFDTDLAGFRVVRSTLMRVTLHLVHAADYRVFREAVEPTLRGARLGDARFTATGLTAADADALLPGLLAYAEVPRTGAELRAWTAEAVGAGRLGGALSIRPGQGAASGAVRRESEEGVHAEHRRPTTTRRGAAPGGASPARSARHPLTPAAWRMLRQYAPLWHAPTGPPWSFGTAQSFVAAADRPVLADPEAAAGSLAALVLRYLEGFGPASVADIGRFALVQQHRARAAVRALGTRLEQVPGPAGTVLYDIPGAPRPDPDTPAPPRLMAMWDSVLLAYADRGRVIPPAYRGHVVRVNGDVLPTLLVDGYVAGVWRPVDGGIEASAFRPLPADAWEGLAAEAAALSALLAARDPGVYRRYDHWWAKGLPAVETRLLGRG